MAAMRILAGRYRLEERLGGGGMSVVWRAYDEVLSRRVAVKMVAGRHANEATARERIRTEVRAAARLDHPHLTRLIDHSDSGGTPYLVMELLEGQTLARRMRAGPLPVGTALEICAQVADALAAAHASGVVHRDVKPGNVMLTPTGASVLDFGIAAFVEEPDSDSGPPGAAQEDRIWATAAYVAPERLTERRVLPASDVYALGVLLYRALTGRHPWPASGRAELLAAHVSIEPAPLPADIGAPPEVAALCDHCLAKQPRERPTARQAATVLATAATDLALPQPALAEARAASAEARRVRAGGRPARAGSRPVRAEPRPRFQRRHAATGSGRVRRNALRVAAVLLVAGIAAAASFFAVTDRTEQQLAPGAAPPPILPGDSRPVRPKGPKPPFPGPAQPRTPPDKDTHLQNASGRAGGLPGSGTVPVRSSRGTGATSPSPRPRPSPRPSPTPRPNPPSPTPRPSPTASQPPVGGAVH